jgi:hypothetical protein
MRRLVLGDELEGDGAGLDGALVSDEVDVVSSVPKCDGDFHTLLVTPKLYIKGRPALDRISKARGSSSLLGGSNRPLCVPKEKANQEAS